MDKVIIKFGDIEIEKQKFQQNKRPIQINNIDINKTWHLSRFATKILKKLDLQVYFSQK